MKKFDLYTENLTGAKLIEASAGTGKTFTLAGLYIRYVVEKKRLPENILVLTFTKAATAELKGRLHEQLIQCKQHLNDTQPVKKATDRQLFDLYERYKDTKDALKYIELALICFDQAAIFTINSFCQKVIDDYNSDCGSPVFQELMQSKDYVKQFTYEFFRSQQKHKPKQILATIPALEQVIASISSLLNKSHYQQIEPCIDWQHTDDLFLQWQQLQHHWQAQQTELMDYQLCGDFNGSIYKSANRDQYGQQMNDFLSSTNGDVEKFCASYIRTKIKKGLPLKAMPDFFTQFESFYQQVIFKPTKTSTGNNFALSFVYACYHYVQKKLTEILNQQGKFDYADQIKVVHQALSNNPELVHKIAKQWHCVMVDEFQDTDKMQLEIFERCFNDGQHDLIYVGDPKQAIYDFRGADVFVYAAAKKDLKNHFNLGTNWRSSDKMLAASNAMFATDNAFLFDWITFQPSLPKPKQEQQLNDIYAPVALIDCPPQDRNRQLADEIKRLLQHASMDKQTEEKIEKTAVQAQNCVILVKSNKEAISLYNYLLSVNIGVSLWSDSSVFSTDVAKCLYFLIRAINYPSTQHIFTTLHGLFFDLSLNQLQQLDQEDYMAEFVQYRSQCHSQNILAVIEQIFTQKQVAARLLQRLDGERHYTDLQHLLELSQQQIELGHNAKQVEQWLATQIVQNQDTQDEQSKRRIESDGKKISIMTIHKSKGLEFEHVFIPYADSIKPSAKFNPNGSIACHDEKGEAQLHWCYSDAAKKRLDKEKEAEIRRNLYVAITRAKYRVYVGVDSSAKNYQALPIVQLLAPLMDRPEMLSTVNFTKVAMQDTVDETPRLSPAKILTRKLAQAQFVYSFSGLSKNQSQTQTSPQEQWTPTDYEQFFHFPSSAKSGSMQHQILENLNFNADSATIQAEVTKQLNRNQYDEQWTSCLTQQIHTILNTQLWQDGPQLSSLSHSVKEMEFMLPWQNMQHKTIAQWLGVHRNEDTPFKHDKLQGFLTGFIDLVFEYENKYYVLDYKSNYLGAEYADYDHDHLQQAIRHHHYDLQYLLYSVALVKYLSLNLPDFDASKHFGGVVYLFTRGINGEPGQGVYFSKPQAQLLQDILGAFHAN